MTNGNFFSLFFFLSLKYSKHDKIVSKQKTRIDLLFAFKNDNLLSGEMLEERRGGGE